jgi:hypothetical protein
MGKFTFCLLSIVLITESAYCFPHLIGQIVSSTAHNNLAIFKQGEQVFTARVGDVIEKCFVTDINYRWVSLLNPKGEEYRVRVGVKPKEEDEYYYYDDDYDWSSYYEPIEIDEGFEVEGDTIYLTEELHSYILEENLGTVMMQAGSEAVYVDGELIGFKLFEIQADSIYDKVGLSNDDIITHIEGVALDSVWSAISMLRSVRYMTDFSFNYIRYGNDNKVNVKIGNK